MTEEKRNPLIRIKGNRLKFLNRDFAVFIFFLFLSFLFWCLNALGKETEAEINYAITFTNPPKERELAEDQSTNINLVFKGTGYSILKLKVFKRKKPFIIDLSGITYKRVPGSSNLDYFISAPNLANSLAIRFRTECEIASLKPDTLFFTLNMVTREANPDVTVDKTDKESDL